MKKINDGVRSLRISGTEKIEYGFLKCMTFKKNTQPPVSFQVEIGCLSRGPVKQLSLTLMFSMTENSSAIRCMEYILFLHGASALLI